MSFSLDGAADPVPLELDRARIPVHVACVMDGNGRWAAKRGLARTDGHIAGEEALFNVVDGALAIGLRWLTVYAFSTENWRRPPDEVRFLMNFNETLLSRRRDELHRRGVRIRFAGRPDRRVPRRVQRAMDEATALTEGNRTMTLTLAFNYGGRAEIIDAVRALVADGVSPGRVNEKAIASRLVLPRYARPRPRHPDLGGVPDLELLAVAARLQRARLLRPDVAGLPQRDSLRGDRRLPAAQSPLRRGERVIFTRIAWVIGLALFATLCWMTIDGFSPGVPLLVTTVVLVVLVAGGNLIGGRSSHGGRGRSRSGGVDDPEAAP